VKTVKTQAPDQHSIVSRKSPISPARKDIAMAKKPKSNLKPKSIAMPSGRQATVQGVRSINGTEYVYIKYGKAVGYAPRDMFVGEKAEARALLKKQGVLIISDRDWTEIVNAVDGIQKFHNRPLIERTGWTGPYFALRDGTVFGPPDAPKATAIFAKVDAENCIGGKLPEWQEKIGAPITGQDLLMVAVMAALASVFVSFVGEKQNFGLELSGPAERGKTTWLLLFASTALRPTGIPTFHATRTGQEDMFGEFRDMPFPVDEANLAESSDKHFVKDFAFRFANGVPKITRNQPDREQFRFVFATTANEPIRDALGKINGDTSDAALQRLMPLRIDPNRAEGVFTSTPEGFDSPGAFATYLGDTIEAQYGTPMRHFLREVVTSRAKDEAKLVAIVRRKIAEFEGKAGISATLRRKTRATTAFGLLYATGDFARAKGILPKAWDCMAACLAAYRNYQSCLPDQTPLATRLLTIAQRPETLDLRGGGLPTLSDAERDSHGAFLKLGKHGRVELLLTENAKRQFFPDWPALKLTSDFKAMNLAPKAKDHDGQQRQVRQGKPKERFICFVLPPEIVEQLPTVG
jgi:hypothetical protein